MTEPRTTLPTSHPELTPQSDASLTAPPNREVPIARWKRVLFTLVMLAVPLTVLHFGAVYYLRVTQGYDGVHLYQYDYDAYKVIRPAANYVDLRGPRHNAQGFRRDTPVSRVKPAGTYRVFLMGGSTAYGTGGLWPHIQKDWPVLKNSQTIDAYLEKILRDSLGGAPVEVVNAAIVSSWTHQHLIYLNQTILGYSPDMVLFLDGFNDFYFYDDAHDQFADYDYGNPAQVIMGEPTLSSLAYANAWWLFRRSPVAHLVGRSLQNAKLLLAKKPVQKPLDVEASLAGLRRTFPRSALKMHRRMGLILRDENVHAVFMQQPMLVLERGRKPMPTMERKLFDFNVSSYLPNYEEYAIRATAFTTAQEAQMAKDVGGDFLDLTTAFDGVPWQAFTDYAHLTPQANQLVAMRIAREILPTIRKDRSGPCGASSCPTSAASATGQAMAR
jgi:hypothetical protein